MQDIHSYRIVRKRKINYISGSCWFILMYIIMIWLAKYAVFLLPFAIIGIAFGIYNLCFAFLTRINLTESGIAYHAPGFSIYCDWHDLTGFGFSRHGVSVITGNNISVSSPKILRWLIGTKDNDIPLFYFMDPPDKNGNFYWNNILYDIKKFAPYLVEKEIKNA